jgi:hypothetical protein
MAAALFEGVVSIGTDFAPKQLSTVSDQINGSLRTKKPQPSLEGAFYLGGGKATCFEPFSKTPG